MKIQLTEDLVKDFDNMKKEAIAELQNILRIQLKAKTPLQLEIEQNRQNIDRIVKLDLLEAMTFFTEQAIEVLRGASLYLKGSKNREYILKFLNNKFKCAGDMGMRAYYLFTRHLYSLLNGPLGLNGKVTYDIRKTEEQEAGTGSVTNITGISRGILRNAFLEQDYIANFKSDNCQTLLRTILHEGIHRLQVLARDLPVRGAFPDEVYEAGNNPGDSEKFKNLPCQKHLENADSYASFALSMNNAYRRIKNYTVTSGGMSAIESKKIDKGDTLWDFADFYYGSGALWPKIWEQNKDRLKSGDPNLIYPDEIIIITVE